jgi:hypothetical protein
LLFSSQRDISSNQHNRQQCHCWGERICVNLNLYLTGYYIHLIISKEKIYKSAKINI